MLHHSFQCLLYCHTQGIANVLVAASGCRLYVCDIDSGHLLSIHDLKSQVKSQLSTDETTSAASATSRATNKDGEPATKKQKTGNSPVASESSSAEIVVEDGLEGQNSFSNAIIKLGATSDGRYVIAITGEDKCVRVFEGLATGILGQVSAR